MYMRIRTAKVDKVRQIVNVKMVRPLKLCAALAWGPISPGAFAAVPLMRTSNFVWFVVPPAIFLVQSTIMIKSFSLNPEPLAKLLRIWEK